MYIVLLVVNVTCTAVVNRSLLLSLAELDLWLYISYSVVLFSFYYTLTSVSFYLGCLYNELIVMMSQSLGELSSAIKKLAEQPDLPVPKGLYEELKSIPGFDPTHLEHYYAYLCENPPLARAFYALPQLSSKMIWVARYIKNHMAELMQVR